MPHRKRDESSAVPDPNTRWRGKPDSFHVIQDMMSQGLLTTQRVECGLWRASCGTISARGRGEDHTALPVRAAPRGRCAAALTLEYLEVATDEVQARLARVLAHARGDDDKIRPRGDLVVRGRPGSGDAGDAQASGMGSHTART